MGDGANWTLAVEISFYALIFLTLVFRRLRLLPWLAVVLTAASVLYTTAHMLVLLKRAPETALLRKLGGRADNLLLRRGMFFALGIWRWTMSRGRLRGIVWAGMTLAAVGGA